MEGVSVGDGVVADGFTQVCAKGLDDGEEDAPVAGVDGVAFYEVEVAVGVGFVVGVEAVEVHDLEEGFAGDVAFLDAVDVGADGVALVDDVELELVFLYGIGLE